MTKAEALRHALAAMREAEKLIDWESPRPRHMPILNDAIRSAEAALAESEKEPVAWRHIKTAPRDGTAILALSEGSDIPQAIAWCDPWANIRTGLNEDNSWVRGWRMTWDGTLIQPIYWMPIPHAPSSAR